MPRPFQPPPTRHPGVSPYHLTAASQAFLAAHAAAIRQRLWLRRQVRDLQQFERAQATAEVPR